jgi:hypothetical protein
MPTISSGQILTATFLNAKQDKLNLRVGPNMTMRNLQDGFYIDAIVDRDRSFWAKTTDYSTQKYAWELVKPSWSGTTLTWVHETTDPVGTTTVDFAFNAASSILLNGTLVHITPIRYTDTSGDLVLKNGYMFDEDLRVFPVSVNSDGGTSGTDTAYTSYTYTIASYLKDPTGVAATAMVPTMTREKGNMAAATHGFAHYDSSSNLILDWVDETALKSLGCTGS